MKLAISSEFIYISKYYSSTSLYLFNHNHEVIIKQEDKKVNLDFRLVSYDLRSKK